MRTVASMTTSDAADGDTVAIDSLDLTTGQMRPADAAHVRLLADVFDQTPPVLVLRDGARRVLLDGHMRVAAARTLGRTEVRVEWVHDDAATGFERAVRANAAHGLPLTRTQRRKAAARLLALAPHWSDRRIGAACGLDPTTVARLRTNPTTRAGAEIPHLRSQERLGRDGRRYPTAEELDRRRATARRLLDNEPGLSDREIARRAQLSAATVRRIRTQPQPDQQTHAGRPAAPRPRRRVMALVGALRRAARVIARRVTALVGVLGTRVRATLRRDR